MAETKRARKKLKPWLQAHSRSQKEARHQRRASLLSSEQPSNRLCEQHITGQSQTPEVVCTFHGPVWHSLFACERRTVRPSPADNNDRLRWLREPSAALPPASQDGKSMTTYRAFLIDEHGHCVGAKVLHGCETDEDAMAAAKQCVDGCAV